MAIPHKVLEIRDSGTHIGVLALRMMSSDAAQRAHLRRAGYQQDGTAIVVMRLDDQKATSDLYEWSSLVGARTMSVAHHYIEEHFDELRDGDVVDVQFILGETAAVKQSEVPW